jgi:nucleoid-associated protein YgaU
LRLTIIISLLVALGLAAALIVRLDGDDAAVTSQKSDTASTEKPASSGTPSASPAEQSASATDKQVSQQPANDAPKTAKLEAPKVIPELVAPSFDVVRVNPAGDAVIAGRAAPGARVSVMAGNKLVGTVNADDRGEWVLVPEKPLESGSRELSLEATLPGAETVKSKNVVIVAVPDRPDDGKSLAILTPRQGGGPSKVLQSASSGSSISEPAKPVRADKTSTVQPAKGRKILVRPAISLDSVDYDDKGDLILSGRADVGASINVYVDNKPVGKAVGRSDGMWQLRPGSVVEPGDHKLRVDQLGTDGKVAHRIELPFTRAEPEQTKLAEGQVIVQPGNSLWRIARRKYGQGLLFTVIYEANREQIRDPDMIYPGQIFALPKTDGSDG